MRAALIKRQRVGVAGITCACGGCRRSRCASQHAGGQSYSAQALVPMESETHSGEDVAIYAWGPTDDSVAGTLEQNMVFHIMARALGFQWLSDE